MIKKLLGIVRKYRLFLNIHSLYLYLVLPFIIILISPQIPILCEIIDTSETLKSISIGVFTTITILLLERFFAFNENYSSAVSAMIVAKTNAERNLNILHEKHTKYDLITGTCMPAIITNNIVKVLINKGVDSHDEKLADTELMIPVSFTDFAHDTDRYFDDKIGKTTFGSDSIDREQAEIRFSKIADLSQTWLKKHSNFFI